MFDAANSIGIEAADYLEQLGYTYTVIDVYVGPEMDEEAVFDDRNPNRETTQISLSFFLSQIHSGQSQRGRPAGRPDGSGCAGS